MPDSRQRCVPGKSSEDTKPVIDGGPGRTGTTDLALIRIEVDWSRS
jgi:hypothetical protein